MGNLTCWSCEGDNVRQLTGLTAICRDCGTGMATPKREERKVTKQFDDDHFIVKALNADIERKGLSVTQYAEEGMLRSPGTIYRWRNGVSPVPIPVRKYLLTRDLWPLINDKQRKVST